MRRQTEEEEVLGIEPKKQVKKPVVSGNTFAEDWQKNMESLKKKIYRAPVVNLFHNRFWYTFGFTDLGKPFSDGPFMTKQEAEVASVQLDTYELFELDTKNRQKAVSEIKHILIERGANPDDALRQQIHHIPEAESKRSKKRWF